MLDETIRSIGLLRLRLHECDALSDDDLGALNYRLWEIMGESADSTEMLSKLVELESELNVAFNAHRVEQVMLEQSAQ